jgi:hypothetical protein
MIGKGIMVPLLVTMDLEIATDHDLQEQRKVLERLTDDLRKLDLPLTVFASSSAVELFHEQVKKIKAMGHEIGLHGKDHGANEKFNTLSLDEIRNIIGSATASVKNLLGSSPSCFRGPFNTTSATTQKVLLENGFSADFSVCSQRVDMFNTQGFQAGWLTAPRKPYFPSDFSPFNKGTVPIVVVPLSCIGVPFISGTMYLFGYRFMRTLFNVLFRESLLSSKPIVYMFHSYEFCPKIPGKKQKQLHRLYMQNREKRYQQNLRFLRYMISFHRARPMTAAEYLDHFHSTSQSR